MAPRARRRTPKDEEEEEEEEKPAGEHLLALWGRRWTWRSGEVAEGGGG